VNYKGLWQAIVRDPLTGRLFESLTDNDVYFIPMDVHLVPPKDLQLHEKMGLRLSAREDGCRVERTVVSGGNATGDSVSERERIAEFLQQDEEALRAAAREDIRCRMARGSSNDVSAEDIRVMEQLQYEKYREMQTSMKEHTISNGD